MCLEMDVKCPLFLMLCVQGLCPTPVSNLKWRIFDTKKSPFFKDL